MAPRLEPPAAVLLLFAVASGAAALAYQIVWMRRLVVVFGSAMLATSTVLVVFLGGLALGAWVWGRVADRDRTRALTIYGLVEIATGAYALASPWAFQAVERAYMAAYPALAGRAGWFMALQFGLSALVILPPTILMGGTVPLLARGVAGRGHAVAAVAALYGWNTLGAAAGAALATYAMLPALGLRATTTAAAAINVLIGVAAWLMDRRPHTDPTTAPRSEPPALAGEATAGEAPRPSHVTLLSIGFALSGLAAMAYEIVWARVLGLVIGSSVYAFGTLVVVMLAGLGLGSALYGRLRLDPGAHLRAFGVLEALIGVAGIASLLVAPRLPFALMAVFPLVREAFAWQIAAYALLAVLIALAPSLLMGATFPAAVGALGPGLPRVGRAIGRAYAANTVGTVVGAYAAGFLLVPGVGLEMTLMGAVLANVVVAATILFVALPGRQRPAVALAGLAMAAVLFLVPPWSRETFAVGTGFFASMFANREGLARGVAQLRLVYYRDGLNTTISVDEAGGHLVYRSNGKTDASTYPIDMANQILLGHVPMLQHPHPRDVFVLGLGTGVTAAAVARHPVRRIDIAELEPAALGAARLFDRQNRRVLDDPRVRVILGDGRNRLLAAPDCYDVIISDASDIWMAGVGALFTREFYETVRARLAPGGLVVQWLHTSSLAPREFRLLTATFRSVYPRMAIWSSGIGDVTLIGSPEPVPWMYDQLRRRIDATPGVREDLQAAGVWHPAALFAAFVIGDERIAEMVGPRPPLHTDDVPTLEFVTPRSLYVDTIAQTEALLDGLRAAPFPAIVGFDPGRDLDALSTYLLGFGYASQRRLGRGIEYMERSVRMVPDRAPLWAGLAARYREAGRTAEAEAAYLRAVAVAPADVQARLALAAFLLDQGHAGRALDSAEAALRLAPGDAHVNDLVARARARASSR